MQRQPVFANPSCHVSRRDLLTHVGGGLAGIALSCLLARDRLLADGPTYDLTPRPPHFAPRARSVICLFMQGGPSQMDLFDPKPALSRYDGRTLPAEIEIFGPGNSG